MPKLEITRAADGLDPQGPHSVTIRTESLTYLRFNDTSGSSGAIHLIFSSDENLALSCSSLAQTEALYIRIRDAM